MRPKKVYKNRLVNRRGYWHQYCFGSHDKMSGGEYKLKIKFFSIIMLCSVPSFAATNWYVKASCGNSGDGTSPTCASSPGGVGAWKNFSDINWGGMSANDNLLLVTGETWSGQSLNVGRSGMTITVYGNGTATIDGGTLNFNAYPSTTIDGVRGDAVSGDYNYGLKFQNYPAGSGCIYSSNGATSNILVQHVECTGTQQTGGDDQGGIRLGGSMTNVELAYNYIHGNSSGSWFISGIVAWINPGGTNPANLRVHHNKVGNLRHDGIKANGNCSFYNNEVYGVNGSGHSDSLLIQSGGNARIYNNYIHDSQDQNIYLDNLNNYGVSNFLIYNNLIVNTGGFGIVLDPEGPSGGGVTNGLDNVHIYNNTFYTTAGPSIRFGGRGSISNVFLKNNIFGPALYSGYIQVDLPNTTFGDSGALDYNVYMTGSATSPNIVRLSSGVYTIDGLRTLSPARETHGKYAAPVFSGFQLSMEDTVAKDSGVSLSTYFISDMNGISRPQNSAWDIGAFEASAPTSKMPLPPVIGTIN